MTFDLNALDTVTSAETGVDVDIVHPVTGAKTGVVITLLGADSHTYREKTVEGLRARAKSKEPINVDDFNKRAAEIAAYCTVGWKTTDDDGTEHDFIVLNGEEVKCTFANAKRVYAAIPVINEQVQAFIEDRRNFFPKAETS